MRSCQNWESLKLGDQNSKRKWSKPPPSDLVMSSCEHYFYHNSKKKLSLPPKTLVISCHQNRHPQNPICRYDIPIWHVKNPNLKSKKVSGLSVWSFWHWYYVLPPKKRTAGTWIFGLFNAPKDRNVRCNEGSPHPEGYEDSHFWGFHLSSWGKLDMGVSYKMVGFPNKPMGFPIKNDHFGVWNGDTTV